VLSTHDRGAITFVIDAHGGVKCLPFREDAAATP
jgi:hypothetical protein